MILLFFWLACSVIGGMIGSGKGEPGVGFAFGLFLGPFGVLIELLRGGSRKQCPFCMERIDERAIVCPRCQRDQPAARMPAELHRQLTEAAVRPAPADNDARRMGLILFAALVVVVVVFAVARISRP